jgi:hypothetical protein
MISALLFFSKNAIQKSDGKRPENPFILDYKLYLIYSGLTNFYEPGMRGENGRFLPPLDISKKQVDIII